MSDVSLDESERNGVVRFITGVVAPGISPWLRETWRGAEHVPDHGPAVIAGNHLSYSDPFVLGRFLLHAGRLPHFLGKAEVFATPVLQRSLALGADVVIYSATKHIDGQGRCLGGVVLAFRGGQDQGGGQLGPDQHDGRRESRQEPAES